jgi:hypothetical protein
MSWSMAGSSSRANARHRPAPASYSVANPRVLCPRFSVPDIGEFEGVSGSIRNLPLSAKEQVCSSDFSRLISAKND